MSEAEEDGSHGYECWLVVEFWRWRKCFGKYLSKHSIHKTL